MPGSVVEEIKDLMTEQHKVHKAVTDSLKKAHEELDGRIGQINKELETRGSETVELKTSFQDSVEKLTVLESDHQEIVNKITSIGKGVESAKSLGELVAANDGLKSYRGGDMVLLDHEGPLNEKATVTSDPGSAGALVTPYRRPGILMNPDQPLTVRDLLTSVPISTASIEWVQENVFTNSADYQAAEGDAKAESGITFIAKTGSVKTIAHWIPLSKQILADAPALQGIVDTRLRYGLSLKEENELLTGDGIGGSILGLIPQSTAYDANRNVSGDTQIDRFRHAILQGTLSLYPVDAGVLNPEDWEKIELLKTDDNAYLFSNPASPAAPRLWGKRIAESHSIAAGNFLTGGFSMGATIWDREQVTVRVAEQHADFFIRNMVAILCEERIGLTVERPAAFITGSFGG